MMVATKSLTSSVLKRWSPWYSIPNSKKPYTSPGNTSLPKSLEQASAILLRRLSSVTASCGGIGHVLVWVDLIEFASLDSAADGALPVEDSLERAVSELEADRLEDS